MPFGVPGPRDLLAMMERAGALLDQLVGAVPRLTALLDTAEGVVADIGELVRSIDLTRVAADGLVARADVAVTEATATVARIDTATTSADALLLTLAAAQARIVQLLDGMEPSLRALQPTLDRLAETTDPREVDALVELIDRLPALAEQVERDVVPVMRTLGTVAPDLHELLDTSRELNEMLAKLPGIGRIRKRDDD
jgi:ABC-type transporter Mla subunit MlaD